MFHSDQGSHYCRLFDVNYLVRPVTLIVAEQQTSFPLTVVALPVYLEHKPPWQLQGYSPVERLFLSLKSEWIPAAGYTSLELAEKDISRYLLDYYNEYLPHSFNDGFSPVAADGTLSLPNWVTVAPRPLPEEGVAWY